MQNFLYTKKAAAIFPNILFELWKGSNNLLNQRCITQINVEQKVLLQVFIH